MTDTKAIEAAEAWGKKYQKLYPGSRFKVDTANDSFLAGVEFMRGEWTKERDWFFTMLKREKLAAARRGAEMFIISLQIILKKSNSEVQSLEVEEVLDEVLTAYEKEIDDGK